MSYDLMNCISGHRPGMSSHNFAASVLTFLFVGIPGHEVVGSLLQQHIVISFVSQVWVIVIP